jgi:hypothetical protein
MDKYTERIPFELDELENKPVIYIEVAQTGREDVAFGAKSFKAISHALEHIVQALAMPIARARPSKASVKFGLEVGLDQGNLVATIVRGTGTANLEITLEWEQN